MSISTKVNQSSHKSQKVPLRLILVVPFVLQFFAAVGIIGYLSFRNGQKAVNDLATQIRGFCKLDDKYITFGERLLELAGEFECQEIEKLLAMAMPAAPVSTESIIA